MCAQVPVETLRAQIDAVLGDIGADVVKTGMLLSAEVRPHHARQLIASKSLSSCMLCSPPARSRVPGSALASVILWSLDTVEDSSSALGVVQQAPPGSGRMGSLSSALNAKRANPMSATPPGAHWQLILLLRIPLCVKWMVPGAAPCQAVEAGGGAGEGAWLRVPGGGPCPRLHQRPRARRLRRRARARRQVPLWPCPHRCASLF